MPISFRTLKQDTMQGYRTGAYVPGTVPGTGGTTTVFVDTNRQEGAGTWDRITTYVKFGTGTPGVASVNDGQVRAITGYSTNGSLTFAPALTASVPSGSTYALFQVFHPDNDVGLAINSTLRDSFPNRVVSSVATTNEQDAVYDYSVPSAAMNAVTRFVKVERSVGSVSSDWEYRELREGFDYKIIDYAGTAHLQVQYLPVASTVLRWTGQRVASDLTADTDTTDEPPALILAGARMFLAMQDGDKDRIAVWTRKYEEAKKDYLKSRPNEPLKLPHFRVGG